MLVSDTQSVWRDTIGEHDQVPAFPSSARSDETLEIEKMRRFSDVLQTRVFFMFTGVLERSVPTSIHSKDTKRRYVRQLQDPVELDT